MDLRKYNNKRVAAATFWCCALLLLCGWQVRAAELEQASHALASAEEEVANTEVDAKEDLRGAIKRLAPMFGRFGTQLLLNRMPAEAKAELVRIASGLLTDLKDDPKRLSEALQHVAKHVEGFQGPIPTLSADQLRGLVEGRVPAEMVREAEKGAADVLEGVKTQPQVAVAGIKSLVKKLEDLEQKVPSNLGAILPPHLIYDLDKIITTLAADLKAGAPGNMRESVDRITAAVHRLHQKLSNPVDSLPYGLRTKVQEALKALLPAIKDDPEGVQEVLERLKAFLSRLAPKVSTVGKAVPAGVHDKVEKLALDILRKDPTKLHEVANTLATLAKAHGIKLEESPEKMLLKAMNAA